LNTFGKIKKDESDWYKELKHLRDTANMFPNDLKPEDFGRIIEPDWKDQSSFALYMNAK